ncbi:MAG: VIT1/CCC1 transporter family protein, partial [Thermaurantiacus sp.]
AMSMAAGEYVSVSSQADTEAADLALERRELARNPEGELSELTHIWIGRGLAPDLAADVARQLTAHDALGAHARDEIGLAPRMAARPVQAAFTSAGTFAAGALLPLLAAVLAPGTLLPAAVVGVSMVALALLGGLGAWAGGAPMPRAILRVSFWGAVAMAATGLAGQLFGAIV